MKLFDSSGMMGCTRPTCWRSYVSSLLAALTAIISIMASHMMVQGGMCPPVREESSSYRVKQPDGKMSPPIYLVGSDLYHHEESEDGYMIIDDPMGTGWKVYAAENAVGEIISSGLRFEYGGDHPSQMGIPKHLEHNENGKRERGGDYYVDKTKQMEDSDFNSLERINDDGEGRRKLTSRTNGTVRNLVIMMKFSDHVGRSYPPLSDYDVLFNSDEPHNATCPTGSVKQVFFVNSYNQLTINSTIMDWVVLPNTEAHYAANRSGLVQEFQDAIRDALDLVDPFVNFTEFDADGDGRIDLITFLHSGYSADWGGVDCYGTYYTHRIWNHKWTLFTGEWISAENVLVDRYHVSPALWGRGSGCETNISRVGGIVHEIGHFLGLPDLNGLGNGQGVGNYCFMANAWGFDGSHYYPPILSPWCKIQLGWVTPTVIDEPGIYEIEQSCTAPQIYKVLMGYSEREYLLIENRQSCGIYDEKIPQPGLAIWHIDESASLHEAGYPGQDGWPANGKHYRVSLVQADGDYGLEQGWNRGDGGDIWHPESDLKALLPSVDPLMGPFPNTDAYIGGNISQTGIMIQDISPPSRFMTFNISGVHQVSTSPSVPPSESPQLYLAPPISSPSVSPRIGPKSIPLVDVVENGEALLGTDPDPDAGQPCSSSSDPLNRICIGQNVPSVASVLVAWLVYVIFLAL